MWLKLVELVIKLIEWMASPKPMKLPDGRKGFEERMKRTDAEIDAAGDSGASELLNTTTRRSH